MKWNEISKWAKEKGFKISKKDGAITWNKIDDPSIAGTEANLDDAATAIFNEISAHRWVEYQKEYKKNLETKP